VASLSPEQRAGLFANLPMVSARQRLDAMAAQRGWRDHQDVFATYLAAYGSREVAEAMQTKFLESLVEARCGSQNASRKT